MPEESKRAVGDYAAHLKRADAARYWRFSPIENLHLTLKFIGEIPPARIDALCEATARATEDAKPFRLRVAGLGAFPPRTARPRALWLGLEEPDATDANDPTPALSQLQRKLEDECFRSGFPREEKTFHLHLTLARARRAAHGESPPRTLRPQELEQKIGRFAPIELAVQSLTIYRSELSPQGSRYTPVMGFALADLTDTNKRTN